MRNHQSRSFFQAIKEAILNKSGRDYLVGIAGGSERYWDRAVAAQGGWSGVTPPPAASRAPGDQTRQDEVDSEDVVGEASEESFPASDAPSWTPLTSIGEPRHPSR